MALGCNTLKQSQIEIYSDWDFVLSDSGSMKPSLSAGDVVYINKKFPYERLKVDDVVAFYDHDRKFNVLHRIIALSFIKDNKKCWILKGDNNDKTDTVYLTELNYLGKLVKVEFDVKN